MLKKCITCEKEFKPWNSNTRFCSLFCFHEYPRKIEQINNEKKCLKCGKLKPLSKFYKRPPSRVHKGYRSHCKKCEIQKAQLWTSKNLDKVRKNYKKRMLTPEGQFKKYKDSAKRFNKKFTLTIDFFKDVKKSQCHYCGSTETPTYSMGIDRVDSLKGYLIENCVACCYRCNLAKFTYSPKEFIAHIFKIARYQKGKNGIAKTNR